MFAARHRLCDSRGEVKSLFWRAERLSVVTRQTNAIASAFFLEEIEADVQLR